MAASLHSINIPNGISDVFFIFVLRRQVIFQHGAFQHMSSLCHDLAGKARSYGYPESSICILLGDETRLRPEYPDTFSNLNSCGHNRDARTAIEYGQDLVASWLFRPDMPLRKNVKEQRL